MDCRCSHSVNVTLNSGSSNTIRLESTGQDLANIDLLDVTTATVTPTLAPDQAGYVFSSFTGDGEDGLHLIASYDGFDWSQVNHYNSVYQQESSLMRDPSIVQGPDGQYHMVWTTGWWEQNIGIAHSSDLLNWNEQTLYVWADYNGPGTEESDGIGWPSNLSTWVQPNDYVRNSWAPEIFYDDTTREYVIYWSSSIDSFSVFPQTWNARSDNLNHRIYYITTKDFNTYTPRKFFYAPQDRVIIDAFICKLGANDYRMILKDEADSGYGNLHIVSSTQALTSWANLPDNFWGSMSAAFTGSDIYPDYRDAEGPTGIKIKNQ
jgi:hypothetical protein